jgi:hypothetical protein
VQHTATTTSTRADFGGNLLVDVQQKLIKPGIVKKGVTHWIGLPAIFHRIQETAPPDNFQVI